MISIIITAWEEPNSLRECIRRLLIQDIPYKFDIWITCPDKKTKQVVMDYKKKYPKIINFLHQPREWRKNIMINILTKMAKGDIQIFLDGDIFISENSIKEIYEKFKDPKIGCVTGRPVPQNPRGDIFGYWSNLLCDAGAHEARLKRAKKDYFLECSGYLWAFRNHVIKKFPIDIAEDTAIPLLFRKRNYKIAYAQNAKVYVKFPTTLKDFIEQKKRTAKAHQSLEKYVNVRKLPRTKTFKNEIFEGHRAFFYPRNIKEIIWTLLLFPLRLYIWILVFYHTKIKKQHYQDAWKRIESTK